MRKVFVSLFCALILSGCYTTIDEAMASWVGQSRNALIRSWGPPDQIMSDGKGGEIFVYENDQTYTKTVDPNPKVIPPHWGPMRIASETGKPVITTVEGYIEYRMFWIDRQGTIYDWASKEE